MGKEEKEMNTVRTRATIHAQDRRPEMCVVGMEGENEGHVWMRRKWRDGEREK